MKRTILLGIDGLDARLVQEFMAAGAMPHCARLAEQGSFTLLRPSLPPMSPVAWSDMATGTDAGQHGIFDFLHRRPDDCIPFISMRNETTGFGGTAYRAARRAEGFWRFTSDAGIPTSVIRWPVTFPAEKVSGHMLCGLGTPDLMGTEGRDALYTTRPPRPDRPQLGADHIVLVRWDGASARTEIEGPRSRAESAASAAMDIRRAAPDTVELRIGGAGALLVRKGEWTPFVRIEFHLGFRRLWAITRFLLVEVEPDLRLYQGPLQPDPGSPVFDISYPKGFSRELASSIGLFSTLGMPESVHPVRKEWFSYDDLLSLCELVEQERMKMLQFELARFREGVLAFVMDTSDRLQHAFWFTRDPEHLIRRRVDAGRYRRVLADAYRRADDAVGRALEAADDQTALFVVSDHGFGPFRRTVQVNRWLIQNGYMHLKHGDGDEADVLFRDVDWSRTRAYALGFTSLYINRKGREAHGIVAPGAEHDQTCREIAERLSALTDPRDGKAVVRKVHCAADVYSGPCAADAPDLVLGLNCGYRVSWQTAAGGAPIELIADNAEAWTGDHLFDPEAVPGVLLSNQKLNAAAPRAVDIAPTLLTCAGLRLPAHLTGRSLL